jgi:dynein heavy chain
MLSQVHWTAEAEEAIRTEGSAGLARYERQCTAQLQAVVERVRGQLTGLERKTLGALIVIDVRGSGLRLG